LNRVGTIVGTAIALLAAGCSGGPASNASSTNDLALAGSPVEEAAANGVVKLRPESVRFVDVEPVVAPDRSGVVRAPARVAFRDAAVAEVGAPIEGRVADVHVQAGDPVRRGEPLVTLSSPAAAAARAELDRLRVALGAARAAAARQARMIESGVGVPAERLAAEAQLAEIEAEVASAANAVAFLGEERDATVIVRAPIDGTVIERETSVGATVAPGNGALVSIGDPNALWVVADVFERDLPLIHQGAPVRVELVSAPGPLVGRVAAVGARLSSTLRAAPVYIALDDPSVTLRAGMYARATIESESPSGVLLPTSAVLIKGGKRTVVYVDEGGHSFAPRDVTVGNTIDGRVHVLAGVVPGDRVVVRGALLLDGAADQLL
jgi:cobalt-zinc-cadmium efflux system membrane fusion protein